MSADQSNAKRTTRICRWCGDDFHRPPGPGPVQACPLPECQSQQRTHRASVIAERRADEARALRREQDARLAEAVRRRRRSFAAAEQIEDDRLTG